MFERTLEKAEEVNYFEGILGVKINPAILRANQGRYSEALTLSEEVREKGSTSGFHRHEQKAVELINEINKRK